MKQRSPWRGLPLLYLLESCLCCGTTIAGKLKTILDHLGLSNRGGIKMQVSSAGLPRFDTYAQALKYFDETVPYRSGSEKGLKPLGSNRRYKYCQIAKDGDNAIHLRLIDSSVVVFYEDGHIAVSLCKWNTVSTRQFIDATTYFSVAFERGQTYLKVQGNWYAFENDVEPMIIQPDGAVRNPKSEFVYRLNRKAFNSKHQEFNSFREYVSNMGKVLVGIKDIEVKPVAERHRGTFAEFNTLRDIRLRYLSLPNNYARNRASDNRQLTLFLETIKKAQAAEDLQTYYDMFVLLGVSSLQFNSGVKAFIVPQYRYPYDAEVEIGSQMLRYFNEVLKFVYKEEVFEKVEVPVGKKVSNENRKYFL